ncbi:hypothetical protein ACLOJK_026175 [Asimina triloba]
MQSIPKLQSTSAANSLSVRSNLEQLMCLKSDNFDVANSWMSLTELKNLIKLRQSHKLDLNEEAADEIHQVRQVRLLRELYICPDRRGECTRPLQVGDQVEQRKLWVANRENYLANKSGILTINDDGDLLIHDGGGKSIMLTSVSAASANSSRATLMNDGNFVLKNSFLHMIVHGID